MPIFSFKNETEWLRERSKDLTSTEVAALLGMSEYKSRFRLWQEKAGLIESDFEDNPFTTWGRRLQNTVALGIAEDMGWIVEDLSLLYVRHPDLKFGSSLDQKVICDERGVGLQEIKTTFIFSDERGWTKSAAPIPYEMQLQAQLHNAKKNGESFDFGVISALDGRKSTRNYFRQYDPTFGLLLENEVADFWQSIREGKPPDPDYIADEELIYSMLPAPRKKEQINLSNNPEAVALIKKYNEADEKIKPLKEQIKPLENEKKEAKNRLLSMVGNAEFATIGKLQITSKIEEIEDSFRYGGMRRSFSIRKLK